MPDARPRPGELDDRAELRLAAMVAEHERRKWSVVAEVIAQLRTLGPRVRSAEPADPADRRRP